VDREKAEVMGVSIAEVAATLNVFMGSEYVNEFEINNRTYRVYAQAVRPFRMRASDSHSYYVRSGSWQMVPLDNLVTVEESAGPPVITHYNLFRAVEIDGSAGRGYSSGQALIAMDEFARQNMMPSMGHEWTGLTLDEIESAGK
jgi:HAE1 family hydrophobic/amphiphilic exporter-1